MGHHGFGNLGPHIRNIVYHRISMFEQRAFAGLLNPGLQNTLRRITESAPRTVPYFLITYVIITQTNDYYAQLNRKNPKDYEHEV
ncbi:cytochrome b-c1 complex subunit 8-like [Diaphorina citri]|jgi:UcrQ family.|uniref:Cytochrome b-c1 complex subunit 8 n=1 Tax=Diaphorina citri TaxID=121845 RepID=A0A1S3DQW5_DIACI|nr:cytochrome b-c1 complex subunit 8-like [Diaphorina citri]XP_026685970.1 cytochrome b-c1 complex subunit 8-like [Diaphorina citri]